MRLHGTLTMEVEALDTIKQVKDLWDADHPVRPIELHHTKQRRWRTYEEAILDEAAQCIGEAQCGGGFRA